MAPTPLDFKHLLVTELRDEVRRVYTYEVDTAAVSIPTGLSKMRKADLIDLLVNAPRKTVESDFSEVAEAATQIGRAISETLPPFVELLGQGLNDLQAAFTHVERQGLNEAKFQGRYVGKPAVVQVRRTVIEGTVIDRVHRGVELLLVIRHSEGFQKHPRVTLHRAVDVLI